MMDDILWATIGAGFLLTIAYVRSELRAHRARTLQDRDRLAQQRRLWPAQAPQSPCQQQG